ncbi:MAG: NAD(P)/FAD-dependent oxidoreductase [Dehalococcoidales bacterium]|nr:NAD(P)/FAD-dependent oxidoreductase [Dehalococcoidales bacterium]
MSDILIIGAGPVGSFTARALATKGYRVTVLEKRSRLGDPVCCAGIISPDCLGVLGGKEFPVLNSFEGARVFSPAGQTLELKRSRVQAVALDRGMMDMKLAEQANLAGARYVFGYKASHIETDDSGVNVYADSRQETCYRAQLLLIAAGFNPVLTNKLGMGKPADFATGVQARVEIKPSLPLCIFTSNNFAPGFFSWLEPLGDGSALAGLLCRKNAAVGFARYIKYLLNHGFITSAEKPQFRGVSLSPLSKTYSNRMLVLGDSAGQVKPITGGGVFYGLKGARCAISQAEKAFATGDFTASSLAGYQNGWKTVLGKDIQLGQIRRKIYEKLSDHQIDKAFRAVARNGLADRLAANNDLQFDDHGRVVLKILKMPAFYQTVGMTLLPELK